MTRTALLGAVAALVAAAQPPATDVQALLTGVEQQYNRARTLEVRFEETYGVGERARKTESGTLYLRKPGRMRWEYSSPAGKLFLSDGKAIYYYNPLNKRAEKLKMKEAEDMRAPLAFLLGKLDFNKDFREFRTRPDKEGTWIAALPKSERLPYRQVEFLISPAREIRRLNITGQDMSNLSFAFSNQKMNPQISDKMFQFELPAGASFIDRAGADEPGAAR